MEQENSYQTIPLSDGTVIKGAFPTIKWYQEITKYISFRNMHVTDFGCCQFSYGVQALKDGALFVQGIDSDPKRIEQSKEVLNFCNIKKFYSLWLNDVEEAAIQLKEANHCTDIAILSMIIHWLKTPEKTIKMIWDISEYIVLVFRYPQEIKEEGYHPTIDQLNNLIGQEPLVFKFLSQTKEQNIALAIYAKDI